MCRVVARRKSVPLLFVTYCQRADHDKREQDDVACRSAIPDAARPRVMEAGGRGDEERPAREAAWLARGTRH